MPRDKISVDELFDILRKSKSRFDGCPSLLLGDQPGLQNAHVIVRSSSTARHEGKYKQFAYRRARNLFHALLDISETLFVLVATSISMSHLVEFQVNDIVPQIEQWWNSCPPSEGLQLQARHVIIF